MPHNSSYGAGAAAANPYLAGGAAFAEGVGNYIGGEEDRKRDRWRFGQQKDFYDKLRWGKRGPVISRAEQNISMAQLMQSLGPLIARLKFDAGRLSGISSPEAHRQITSQTLPIVAGETANIQRENRQMTFAREQNMRHIMASLVRG